MLIACRDIFSLNKSKQRREAGFALKSEAHKAQNVIKKLRIPLETKEFILTEFSDLFPEGGMGSQQTMFQFGNDKLSFH